MGLSYAGINRNQVQRVISALNQAPLALGVLGHKRTSHIFQLALIKSHKFGYCS